ncbi:MAG: 5-methylcytosine restriction system specificity protein McrC [Fervidobacterium sp.]
MKKVKQENYIVIDIFKDEYEEDENDTEASYANYGNKITSKIIDINLDTGEINTKNYVGILKGYIELDGKEKFEVTIEIGSRFDTSDKQFFLVYLLSFVYKINIYEKLNPKDSENSSIWTWLTVIAFKYILENAFNNGLFKKYRSFENNDCKVKGVVNLERHIKYNIPFNGKIAYNKRELTYDNEIMHLILHAFDVLNKRFPDKISKFMNKTSKAYEAICTIREVAPNYKSENVQSLISKCYRRITHPYYHKYEPLRKICLLILKNKGISFFDRESSDINGVIININKLWEIFLYKILSEKIENTKENFKVNSQAKVVLQLKKTEDKEENFTLKPDFVIEKEKTKYVLDAKYKVNWENFISTSNITDVLDDYRQITNYVYLLNANWGGVIFPYKESKQDLTGYYLVHENEKYFYFFGLKIPEENISNWNEQFKKNIDKLIEEIKTLIA